MNAIQKTNVIVINSNKFLSGFLYGVLLPVAGFVLLYRVFALLEIKGAASSIGLSENFRERTLAIIAIALNLVPLNIFRRRRWDQAIRGVVVATTVLAVVWVIRYGLKLL
jgi:hypothetical protein